MYLNRKRKFLTTKTFTIPMGIVLLVLFLISVISFGKSNHINFFVRNIIQLNHSKKLAKLSFKLNTYQNINLLELSISEVLLTYWAFRKCIATLCCIYFFLQDCAFYLERF